MGFGILVLGVHEKVDMHVPLCLSYNLYLYILNDCPGVGIAAVRNGFLLFQF